jgi:hypothetical protein
MSDHWTQTLKAENAQLRKALDYLMTGTRAIAESRLRKNRLFPYSAASYQGVDPVEAGRLASEATQAYGACAQETLLRIQEVISHAENIAAGTE